MTSKPSQQSEQENSSSSEEPVEVQVQQSKLINELFNLEAEQNEQLRETHKNEMPLSEDPMKEFFEEHELGITK